MGHLIILQNELDRQTSDQKNSNPDPNRLPIGALSPWKVQLLEQTQQNDKNVQQLLHNLKEEYRNHEHLPSASQAIQLDTEQHQLL